MVVNWSIGTSPDDEMVNAMLDNAASMLAERTTP